MRMNFMKFVFTSTVQIERQVRDGHMQIKEAFIRQTHLCGIRETLQYRQCQPIKQKTNVTKPNKLRDLHHISSK